MISTEVKTFYDSCRRPIDAEINAYARGIGKEIKSISISHSSTGTLTAIVIFESIQPQQKEVDSESYITIPKNHIMFQRNDNYEARPNNLYSIAVYFEENKYIGHGEKLLHAVNQVTQIIKNATGKTVRLEMDALRE